MTRISQLIRTLRRRPVDAEARLQAAGALIGVATTLEVIRRLDAQNPRGLDPAITFDLLAQAAARMGEEITADMVLDLDPASLRPGSLVAMLASPRNRNPLLNLAAASLIAEVHKGLVLATGYARSHPADTVAKILAALEARCWSSPRSPIVDVTTVSARTGATPSVSQAPHPARQVHHPLPQAM